MARSEDSFKEPAMPSLAEKNPSDALPRSKQIAGVVERLAEEQQEKACRS